MIEIACVLAGGAMVGVWMWAFRTARDERLKARITLAVADRARAELALDRAVASGYVRRMPSRD